jgi:intein-encoded DNA endonuclease-like protein
MFTSEKYRRLSEMFTKKYDLSPDADLGWLVGIILGDGYIWRMQSGGYVIGLDTPEAFYAGLFASTMVKRFPGLWVRQYFRRRNRLFRSGKFVEEVYTVRAVSRFLYDFLRPHKQPDFHWTIPLSIRESQACIRGFLQGIYDAEGGVQTSGQRICLTSKHSQNLSPVGDLLQEIEIESRLYRDYNCSRLFIWRKKSMRLFRDEIGFRLPRKQQRLVGVIAGS